MDLLFQLIYYLFMVLFLCMGAIIIKSFCMNAECRLSLGILTATGLSIISIFILSYLGIPMKIISYLLIGMVLSLFLLQLYRRKISFLDMKKVDSNNIKRFIIAVCIPILYLLPIIVYKRIYYYSDLQTYVCNADFYRTNSYLTPPPFDSFSGWLYGPFLYFEHGLRCGAQLFLAFWSELFRVELSIEVIASCMALGIFLFIIAALYFGENFSEKLDNKTLTTIVVMSGLNTTVIIWSASTGLFPQLYGFSFALTTISCFFNRGIFKKSIGSHILLGIVGAALVISYGELVPFVALGLFIYFLFIFFKKNVATKEMIKYLVFDLISVLLFSALYLPNFVKSIFYQLKTLVGYEMPIDILKYLGYFFSTIYVNGGYQEEITGEHIVWILLTLIVVTLFIGGLIEIIKNKHTQIITEIVSITIPYIIMAIYYGFVAKNPYREGLRGNSWSIYKLVQYYTAFMIPYTAIFIAKAIKILNRKKFSILLAFVWILSNIGYGIRYGDYITKWACTLTGNAESPMDEYFALREKYKDYTGKLYLNNVNASHQLAIDYFLKEHEIYTIWGKEAVEYDGNGIVLTFNPSAHEKVANLAETDVWIDYGPEIYDLEYNDQESWRWASGTSYILFTPNTNEEYQVAFKLQTIKDNSNIKVYLDQQLVYEGEVRSDTMKAISCKVTPSNMRHEIKIEYAGESYVGEGGDIRTLAYRIIDFTIHSSETLKEY